MVALKKSSIIIISILVNKTSICRRNFSSRPQRRYQSKAKPKIRTKHKKVKQTKNILPMKQKQPHKENLTHCNHHQDHKKKKTNKQTKPVDTNVKDYRLKHKQGSKHCYTYISLQTNRGKYSKKPTLSRVSITHIGLLA